MIDDELHVRTSSTPLTKGGIVADLLDSPLIESYRYREDGPPTTAVATAPASPVGWPSYKGWVVVTEADPQRERWVATYESGADSRSQAGIMGDAVAIAAADTDTTAYTRLDQAAATERRRADGLAAQVASQALEADIYISDREYLHAATWRVARGVAVCRPDQALPLIGLYLRAQGDFRITSNFTCNRGLYYWVGMREVLPATWRWFAACVQHDAALGAHDFGELGQSLLQRVERALEARDRLHIALNQPQHNDTRREVLTALDDVLIDLMGAVDVSARVAHRVLGLPPAGEFRAAWQNTSWRAQLAQGAAALAKVTASGTVGLDALTILRLLRNSVHGTALQAIALQEADVRSELSMIGLPSDATDVLAAMERLGGEVAWGVRGLLPDRVLVDAGLFLEALIPHILKLLNALMGHTPVETLPHVKLSADDCRPPAPDPRNTGIWDEWVRTSIRWQLGL
jgi:hypothetical protein